MRVSCKNGLLSVVVIAALVLSAAAAPVSSPSMGVILQADNANLSGSPVVNGASIFNGDTLTTDRAGSLRARFGSAQIYLYPNSNVSVDRLASGFSARLNSGTVLLSSGPSGTYQVMADGAIVQPKGNQQSVAQISWVGPTELLLSSQEGDLQVTMGDETQTVTAGSSYRMMIMPASQPAASPAAPAPVAVSGSNSFYLVAVVLIITGTVIALIRALESESSIGTPTHLSAGVD